MLASSLDPAPSLASLPRAGVLYRLLFLFLRCPALVATLGAGALLTGGIVGGLALHQLGDTRAGWGVYHVASSLALAGLAAGALAVGSNRAAGRQQPRGRSPPPRGRAAGRHP